MQVVHYPGILGNARWAWEMPELIDEIPSLFGVAGRAKVVKTSTVPHWVCVEVSLKTPAEIISSGAPCIKGLSLNRDTLLIYKCRSGVSPTLESMPRTGDKKVRLWLHLELTTFFDSDTFTLADLRAELRKLAEALSYNKWYI